MGPRLEAAIQASALYFRLRLMALVLPMSIVSLVVTTEVGRMRNWFYWAMPCMGRPFGLEVLILAPCSPSTPMAQVLEHCIVFQAVATAAYQEGDWFYQATSSTGQHK